MKVPPCPRCNGRIFREDDEWVCLACGCRPSGFGVKHETDQRLMRWPGPSFADTGNRHYIHHGAGATRRDGWGL